MTETPDLARHLFDRLTQDGHITLDAWCAFKREHHVEAQQIEPVLVLTIRHILTLADEIQQEANRLAHAVARRG